MFWLASCGKLITSIAGRQLVEQKRLSLDDSDQLEIICPELKHVRVLEETADGSLKLVAKRSPITLRMLLPHTGEYLMRWMERSLNRSAFTVNDHSRVWIQLHKCQAQGVE
jgi:CubicO group peptidase (beta-lactamase class C family)